MKNLLIALLIISTLATGIVGGVFLFSQTTGAQSLASHNREPGEGLQAPPSGEQVSTGGPFGGDELRSKGGHDATALGALPELFGHLTIMVVVILGTLGVQKIVRRLPRLRSA